MHPTPRPETVDPEDTTGRPPLSSPQERPAQPARRVLFTAVPIHGHLLPMLPLAEAVTRAGDHATFLIPASMAELVNGLPVLACGPDIDTLLADNARRTGATDLNDISALAQFFTATRIDLSFDKALRHARNMCPDVVIADEYDTIGPMLAAALGVPLIQHAIGLPISPPALAPAMENLLIPRYVQHGLTRSERIALVDPWPPALQDPHRPPAPDRMAIRPQPYDRPALTGPTPPASPGTRPRVLITLGTVLLDTELLHALVNAVAAIDDVEVLALVPPGITHPLTDSRTNVSFATFTPMAHLLTAGVSVIVAAGGAGTVLAAMSHAIPMVILPKGAEKPQNAERITAAGAGITITEPAQAGDAVRTLLADPSYRTSAERIAAQIRRAPDPDRVWAALKRKLPAPLTRRML